AICGCQDGSNPSPGSYNSALLVAFKRLTNPAATSTLPLASKLAECAIRGTFNGAVTVQPPLVPALGSYSSTLLMLCTAVFRPPATSTWRWGSKVAVG